MESLNHPVDDDEKDLRKAEFASVGLAGCLIAACFVVVGHKDYEESRLAECQKQNRVYVKELDLCLSHEEILTTSPNVCEPLTQRSKVEPTRDWLFGFSPMTWQKHLDERTEILTKRAFLAQQASRICRNK